MRNPKNAGRGGVVRTEQKRAHLSTPNRKGRRELRASVHGEGSGAAARQRTSPAAATATCAAPKRASAMGDGSGVATDEHPIRARRHLWGADPLTTALSVAAKKHGRQAAHGARQAKWKSPSGSRARADSKSPETDLQNRSSTNATRAK